MFVSLHGCTIYAKAKSEWAGDVNHVTDTKKDGRAKKNRDWVYIQGVPYSLSTILCNLKQLIGQEQLTVTLSLKPHQSVDIQVLKSGGKRIV